ncbi:hypothetical protein [Dyadobacter sp. CY356]|uniref:hypothetical protein n=1 Tax=Dyadobacter sp. CY356 TaxID=2906442 RepID=UPI001F37BE3B|nr:hypothetical protein [Dyadobacter sp. CY356]MCF0054258.1 hypothetical protein [Dyadobacter sp. CY356]
MNKPTPEELQSFFRSDIFRSERALNGDFTQAIEAFYERFYSAFDQKKYNEIGIHIDDIRREQLLFDEQTDTDFKVIIDFHFIQEPENKQSFSLIGAEEEKMFYDQDKEELLSFFILRFRRYSRLLIQ